MLRQLAALTRRLPAAGPSALALAVYAGSTGEHHVARERGVEGVACVDDAARASVLLYRLWAATGNHSLKYWADGLLEFVLWMNTGDGRWHNFIYDWEGTQNTDGPTSAAGVNFWQARAMCALAEVNLIVGHECNGAVMAEALAAAASATPPSDVRAIHASGVLACFKRAPDREMSRRLSAWCDEIAACQRDGMLMNSPDERGRPHLWGHVQEAVLADASVILGRPELCAIAVQSAEAVFVEAIESGFDIPHVHSYDVQSTILVMDRLAEVTGRPRYAGLAEKARRWFDGRNPAGAIVYDRAAGRVADGVDDRHLNDRSGAEANVTAGLALLLDKRVVSMARSWTSIW